MVKELRQYNQDISPYVPAAILRYMDGERSL